MQRSRLQRAAVTTAVTCMACVVSVALATTTLAVREAHAQQPAATGERAGGANAPGGPALRQARAAWERGALDTAEPLYREALEKGGLSPDEVLEGYVRLGAVRAARGKKDQAVAAFRAASIIDANFAVPTQAGPKGATLAAQAKKDTAKIGSIQLSMQVPKEVSPGKPFKVTAVLDAPHLPIVTRLVVVAKDGTSGKEATVESKPGESTELEVPGEVALPSASILVRLDALDAHANRLASVEERVRVPETEAETPKAATEPAANGRSPDPMVRKGGGFWSSPWPYVIGGLALTGAGAAIFFGTRPPPDVSVGQVGVQTR